MIITDIKTLVKKIYKDSLLKNSIFLILTHSSNAISGFFFWVIAARYYTPDDIGIISAILSSVALISTMSLIGFPTALIYYLPRFKYLANNIINSSIIIEILISATFSIIFILGMYIWSPKLEPIFRDIIIIFIFIITTIMTNISGIMTSSFTAGRRSSFYMVKENIFSLSKIIFLILFMSLGVVGMFISWSFGLIIAVISGFILLIKLWKYYPTFVIDPMIKNMVSYSSMIYIAGVLYTLPKIIFPIIILNLISAEAAGYFYIAMTMASLLYSIPMSIGNSFLAESSNKVKFWNNIVKSIKFNIGVLVPGVLIFMVFGRFILGIFNPSYAENSLESLIILAAASIPMSLTTLFCQIKNSQNKIPITIIINGMTAAITFALAISFIKIWNIEGIAAAYLVANTIMATIIVFKMRNTMVLKILNGKKSVDTGLINIRI